MFLMAVRINEWVIYCATVCRMTAVRLVNVLRDSVGDGKTVELSIVMVLWISCLSYFFSLPPSPLLSALGWGTLLSMRRPNKENKKHPVHFSLLSPAVSLSLFRMVALVYARWYIIMGVARSQWGDFHLKFRSHCCIAFEQQSRFCQS